MRPPKMAMILMIAFSLRHQGSRGSRGASGSFGGEVESVGEDCGEGEDCGDFESRRHWWAEGKPNIGCAAASLCGKGAG